MTERPTLVIKAGPFVCTGCSERLPGTDFYWAWNTRDARHQRDPQCKDCSNSRSRSGDSTSQAKVVSRRARQRATARLLQEYPERFAELLEQERRVAATEFHMLTELAVSQGQKRAVLKPGPRRPGQEVGHRLDVASCRRCHTHHDAGHVCPNCGAGPEEADLLANELDDDLLRADISRDLKEGTWA